MKLLVTGGAGYIGSVVAAQLLEAGHNVTVADNLSTGHRDAVPAEATFCKIDIQDALQLLEGVDAVLHFAAYSLVSESVAHPELYWSNNVVGTLRLLDAMRVAGVQTLIFSSTAATYGEPTSSAPITERTPTMPLKPYGQSKLAIDHAVAGEAAAHGLAAVSLRYFNVGGASGRYGERHDPETHLIPNVLGTATKRLKSVDIYGTNYPTRDGTAVRDYLHVEDLGRAHLLALEAASPGSHQIFNVSTGTGYTVREVVDACRRITGHPVPSIDSDRRPGDPAVLVASGQWAAEQLGWTPRHDLDRIVTDAWTFMRSGGRPYARH